MIWLYGATIYCGIGFVWSVYLFHASRIEGEFGDIVYHMVTWPLDLACWIESKFISR